MSDAKHDLPDDEFFVGYLPVPKRLTRFLVTSLAIILCGGAVLDSLVAGRQRDPGSGSWDLTQAPTIEGVLHVQPYPSLTVDRDHLRKMILVGEGKVGANSAQLQPLDGRRIRIRGHLIEREGRTILEIESTPELLDETIHANPTISNVSPITLVGEVIDPKCFHGAMKPGEGKTHKACASLCLRGGIPPMFLGTAGTCYLIVDESANALSREGLEELIEVVGERVQVQGEAGMIEGQAILKIGPHAFHRLNL